MLTQDEIILLAFALEYDCNDKMQKRLASILEKVENNLHVDAVIGHRLYEHGKIMGWSKEQ